MTSSPSDHRHFATVYQTIEDTNVVSKCTVWQIPIDATNDQSNSLTID
ncbi:unnamed protein product, partial [Rotaria magnacalcarata]